MYIWMFQDLCFTKGGLLLIYPFKADIDWADDVLSHIWKK